ncbi:hypothetical protein SeMB42_g03747 [Synchytrium endobioticum]|uniref:NAD(P)-binding protein n=1 Tax=Synchytrium endobioticum TaxID=286115 RepID=A0A507CSL8_9FUNG|nr:hypothetical protein SeLEV6574_g05735 [Synchytrium endobioticum]TPX46306.1 hypothetical protein SeMB42_g03747 [Synchytrium endobioticum]
MSRPVIIVTGASRGIGLATVQAALFLGCNVVGAGRTELSSLPSWTSILQKYPDHAHYVQGDLTSQPIAKELVAQTIAKYGHIDSVVLNAGILPPLAKIRDTDLDEAKRNFDVNFWCVWLFVKESINEVAKRKGRYIIVSSGGAVHAIHAWGAYCCSKAALNMLGFMIAAEEPNVTTISLRPGTVDTDMQKLIRDEVHHAMPKESYQRFVSLKETDTLVKVEDTGYQLAKMALEASRELNGQFLDYKDEKLAAFRRQ